MSSVWMILLLVVWVPIVIVSGFLTVMMFAFADSPGAGKAAQKMIGPIFVLTIALFMTGAWLLKHGMWWSIPSAFAVVIAPPALVFAGYNILMRK